LFVLQEKGNTPVHVAAKAGQSLQVELLVTYGADPAACDTNKLTPESLARGEGHHELADRLVELQYELSDRMSNFVWGMKPGSYIRNLCLFSKLNLVLVWHCFVKLNTSANFDNAAN